MGILIVSTVLALISAINAYQSDTLSQTCDLYASFTSSSSVLIREYCYNCSGDINNRYYINNCVNRNCRDPKFDIIENGSLSYYQCWGDCGGLPMACEPLVDFDHGEYLCSEDLEQKSPPRKFLACQTCQAVCNHGYQLKQPVTNTCMRKNTTHIGWNGTEIKPVCISITQICDTPDISGVNLEGCEIHDVFDSSTKQYMYHQVCTARCEPGLYQVFHINTSCGENGVWSNLDKMEKLCVNPSQGCEMKKPPLGSWNCTGTWLNTTMVSSGSLCYLDCGDLRDDGNIIACNNTHLSRRYGNLPYPSCYNHTGTTDGKEPRYDPWEILPLVGGIILILVFVCWKMFRKNCGNFSECSSCRTTERNGSLLVSESSQSSSVGMTSLNSGSFGQGSTQNPASNGYYQMSVPNLASVPTSSSTQGPTPGPPVSSDMCYIKSEPPSRVDRNSLDMLGSALSLGSLREGGLPHFEKWDHSLPSPDTLG